MPVSCSLAYVDPQIPCVGFGSFDTVAITGFELMSSLVLHRGRDRLFLMSLAMRASRGEKPFLPTPPALPIRGTPAP